MCKDDNVAGNSDELRSKTSIIVTMLCELTGVCSTTLKFQIHIIGYALSGFVLV